LASVTFKVSGDGGDVDVIAMEKPPGQWAVTKTQTTASDGATTPPSLPVGRDGHRLIKPRRRPAGARKRDGLETLPVGFGQSQCRNSARNAGQFVGTTSEQLTSCSLAHQFRLCHR
jgi:hypothetical protein